jgi:hypothetical protein
VSTIRRLAWFRLRILPLVGALALLLLGLHGPRPAAAGDDAVNCALHVPDQPLTAQGLATPWRLSGGPACSESNPNASAFVQAAVIDPATGRVAVYDPLVIDVGSRPAAAPTVPNLPPGGGVVGIWIGYNGDTIRLVGPGSGACQDGVRNSLFGQNAFCDASQFFTAANAAIARGQLTVPDLGTAKDGKPCPTTRDFSVVDQDQSDNTTDDYLVTRDGSTAQDTPQNRAALPGATSVANGSDEGLMAKPLDTALGCTPWTAPDLADATHTQNLPALPLNELQAAAKQGAPVALVPALDPFVVVDGHPDLDKLNAYRVGVDQAPVTSLQDADTAQYCRSLLTAGAPRLAMDRPLTAPAASPFPAMANTLFNFLALRFSNTWDNLGCADLIHVDNPVRLRMDGDVVAGAAYVLQPGPPQGRHTPPASGVRRHS